MTWHSARSRKGIRDKTSSELVNSMGAYFFFYTSMVYMDTASSKFAKAPGSSGAEGDVGQGGRRARLLQRAKRVVCQFRWPGKKFKMTEHKEATEGHEFTAGRTLFFCPFPVVVFHAFVPLAVCRVLSPSFHSLSSSPVAYGNKCCDAPSGCATVPACSFLWRPRWHLRSRNISSWTNNPGASP